MDGLQELLQNDILWAGILSWFTAQVVKTILYAVLNKTLDFTRLVGDGGMPSAHSATVTADFPAASALRSLLWRVLWRSS